METNNSIHAVERELRQAERRRRELQRIAVGAAALCAVVIALLAGWGISSLRAGEAKATAAAKPEPALIEPIEPEEPALAVTAATVETIPVDEEPLEETPVAAEPEPAEQPKKAQPKKPEPKPQRVRIRIGEYGYEPSSVRLSADRPVELTVEQGEGCAEGFLISKLDVNADNSAKDAVVRLGKVAKGTYRFTCGMEMVEGRLIVE